MRIFSKDEKIIKDLFVSLLPVQCVLALLPEITNLLNSYIVGNYFGGIALATVGFAVPVTEVYSFLSYIFVLGTQVLASQQLGKGNLQKVCRVLTSGMVAAVFCGTLLWAFCQIFLDTLCGWLCSSSECIPFLQQYLKGFSWGYPLGFLILVSVPLLQLDNDKKRAFWAMFAMMFGCVSFNLLNVFYLHLGMLGVGLAYPCGCILASLVIITHFCNSKYVFKFKIALLNVGSVLKVIAQGVPSSSFYIFNFVRAFVLNHYLFETGGNVAVAALVVANTVSVMVSVVAIPRGITNTLQILAGVLCGERDVEALRRLPRISFIYGFPMMVLGYVIINTFAEPLALFLGMQPADLPVIVLVFRYYLFWLVTDMFLLPAMSIYLGIGSNKSYVFYRCFCTVVFPTIWMVAVHSFGVHWLVSYSWMAEVNTILLMILHYYIVDRTWPISIFNICYIPNKISVPRKDRFMATVHSVAEAMETSKQAISFCLQKGLSNRLAQSCGLCLEEMMVNTFEHNEGIHGSVDLRIVFENSGIFVTLRDDYPKFDPKSYLDMCNPDDLLSSPGVRIVTCLAKDMNYASVMGLNVLTFRLENK